MKIVSENGSIEGWFIAMCETILVYGVWIASIFFTPAATMLKETSGFITSIYGLSFGAWLAYKGASTIWGK